MKDSECDFLPPTPQMMSLVGVSSDKSDSAKQVSAFTGGGDISVSLLYKRRLWTLVVLEQLKRGEFFSAELRS